MRQRSGHVKNYMIVDGGGSQDSLRQMYLSTAGIYFIVNPDYIEPIKDLIAQVRSEMAKAKESGRFLTYLSVPVSPRGGGHFETNNAIANATAKSIRQMFGDGLAVVNSAAFNLPMTGATPAGGGEYMAVWSDVLAGPDGLGGAFDMVYFVGPSDVAKYFGLSDTDRLSSLGKWVDEKAASDPAFKEYITVGDNRRQFIRYYGIRGSTVYSKGGHDEWNIVAALNTKRPTGDDIAVYFDGRPIEPGDYDDSTDPGYQAL